METINETKGRVLESSADKPLARLTKRKIQKTQITKSGMKTGTELPTLRIVSKYANNLDNS